MSEHKLGETKEYRRNPLHTDGNTDSDMDHVEVVGRRTEEALDEEFDEEPVNTTEVEASTKEVKEASTKEVTEASTKEMTESQGETKTSTYDNETEKEYGYSIFWVILNTLFPERFRNGIDVSINPNSDNFTRCFEDGGFVFNDVNHGLFNILLGANYNSEIVDDSEPPCRMNETLKKGWKHKTGTFDKLERKTHFLLDQLWKKRSEQIAREYEIFQLIRAQKEYKYGKKQGAKRKAVGIIEIPIEFEKKWKIFFYPKKWHRPVASALGIYERYIGLKDQIGMKAICNPKNEHLLNTSYKIKDSGKSLLKFYCLKFIKKTNGKIFYLTYVKAETLPHGANASEENKNKSAIRVASRMLTKPQKYEITKRGEKLQIPRINFKAINSTEKEVYPYRNEDRGNRFNFRDWATVTINKNWNTYFNGYNACGDEECLKEIFQYSNVNQKQIGETLVPQMRTGYEFFVPSVVTSKIVNILEPLKRHFCKAKYNSIMTNDKSSRIVDDGSLLDFNTFKAGILSSQSGGASKKEAFRKSFTKKGALKKSFGKTEAFRKRFTQKRALKKRFTKKRALGKALKKRFVKKTSRKRIFKKNLASKSRKV